MGRHRYTKYLSYPIKVEGRIQWMVFTSDTEARAYAKDINGKLLDQGYTSKQISLNRTYLEEKYRRLNV